MKMSKTYNPKEFEDKHYDTWCKKGYFTAKVDSSKQPFSIVMPPPNITGQLHMGHALDNSVQDTIIRFKRMQGYSALWLPGTDHASIATELKIVAKMKEEGVTKEEIGRDGFLKRAWDWKRQYGGRIVEQLKKLGSSCDWSREAFTLDDRCSNAVKHVFVKMYEKGLIYKGARIINRCPSCNTALSDAEVEYKEQNSFLWHVSYPLEDGSGKITIATTRPETILGDTAVAVNITDERYAHLVGKNLILPLVNKSIPVVADDYVEKDFGTGAVKITPAHDTNDFEVGLRHNLPVVCVMNDDGTMNENAGIYEGLTREECRDAVVKDLTKWGNMVKIEPYTHNVGVCYRCSNTVEPIVSQQWFVKMKSLAEPAVDVVKNGEVEFIPNRFEKTYLNWMENIKDWCISRQLWWGHRIPAYYCAECGEMTVSESNVDVCPVCGGSVCQDEDVLDTWFSSALWPFSTLGYPEKTADLKYFYPTDVLVTAYDIIFFWVARMIFSGLEHMGCKPFSEVLIHGLVRDEQGRKMSKSANNGIDPLKIIDEFGADSLRLYLLMGVAPGGDMRFIKSKLISSRNFLNKVWNASRFVTSYAMDTDITELESLKLKQADKWILTQLDAVTKEVTANLEKYELGLAAGKLYDFVWSDFCDWYLELVKPALYGTSERLKANTVSVLVHVLTDIVKLLHPFVPFITEEIWQSIPNTYGSIMTSDWPSFGNIKTYDVSNFESVRKLITDIRSLRAEKKVAPSKKIDVCVITDTTYIASCAAYIKKLAGVENILFIKDKNEVQGKYCVIVSPLCEMIIPLGNLVDTEKEIERLKTELETAQKEASRAQSMLSNEAFIAKAPKALIDKENAKLNEFNRLAEKLKTQISEYNG